MKPGESKEVDITLNIHYKVTAAGVGHFQAVATCEFHGKKFEGKGSHPVGALTRNNPLIDSMAMAFGQLVLEMQAEFEKHRMLPHGVMLKPEAEALHDALIDLFELPQTERRMLRAPEPTSAYPRATPEQGPYSREGVLLDFGPRCRYGGNMPSACGLHQGHEGTHERLYLLRNRAVSKVPMRVSEGDIVNDGDEHDEAARREVDAIVSGELVDKDDEGPAF
jgi:hypothetical protein